MCRSLRENHQVTMAFTELSPLPRSTDTSDVTNHLGHHMRVASTHIWSYSLPPTAENLELQPPSDCRERSCRHLQITHKMQLFPHRLHRHQGLFRVRLPYLLSHWYVAWPHKIYKTMLLFLLRTYFLICHRGIFFFFLISVMASVGPVVFTVWFDKAQRSFKNILLAELVAFLANWMLGPKASSGSCSIPLVVCSLSRRPTLYDCPCSCESSRFWCSKCPHPLFHWGQQSGDILISFSRLIGILTRCLPLSMI